jgi:cyclopropane fatty-acyl-phospholipid synthase-like methyltransferase
VAAATGLKLLTAEFLGRSYARTLAEWQRRFQVACPPSRRSASMHDLSEFGSIISPIVSWFRGRHD